MSGFRPSKLEPWQLDAAKRLEEIVKREGVGQEALRAKIGVSHASQVSQMLGGLRPINIFHAAGFAEAVGCTVDDFSVELANQIRQLASKVAWTPTGRRYWPFLTRPDEYDGLSMERKREIANYISERVALSKPADSKTESRGQTPSQRESPRQARKVLGES